MPKERKDKRSSKNESIRAEGEKEWREARCPVCMEHPHNAVLLICSSHEKGCRPYMCDTSYRQSNCFDQFLKLAAANESSTEELEEEVSSASASESHRRRNLSKLVCPLCRGQISNWVVMDPARQLMNSKKRSCSLETCDFVGNYSEIRKHARCVHPKARPMEMDPTRQLDWERSERQRDLQDLDSALQSGDEFEYEEEEQGGGGESSPIGQPMDTRQLDWVLQEGGGGRSSPINMNILMRGNRRLWRTGGYVIRANRRSWTTPNTRHQISGIRRRSWIIPGYSYSP